MTRRPYPLAAIALLLVVLLPWSNAGADPSPQVGSPATPLGAGFTYQGRLDNASGPVTGTCDFEFRLWDSASGGTQVGNTQTVLTVSLTNGLFTVTLNDAGQFGATPFAGEARWLEIAVRCPAGGGTYTTLATRQALTAAPYASYAPVAGSAPWSGLTGVPAGFADGIDNDTTYSAGYGLNLAGTTFGVVTSTIQARVSGNCTPGSMIRTIDADGTVTCWTDAPLNRPTEPATNTLTTLDSTGDVGYFTSATVGTDGRGLISYYDNTNADLKVAHCSNMDCSAAVLTTLDSAGVVGSVSSITLGADGHGLIAYRDNSSHALKVAHCSNINCTAATLTILDNGNDVGYGNSVTVGADGLGLISYYDNTDDDLKVAHCSNTNCTAATVAILDSAGDVGQYTSITLGADRLGLIAYYDTANGDLKVAHCSNTECSAATLTTVDNAAATVGYQPSITLGADGFGLISYYNYSTVDLKVAHCSNTDCTAATLVTLDSPGSVGFNNSITVGADGLGLISYLDITNGDLKVAHCADTLCTTATLEVLDTAGNVGSVPSITLGADGLGLISYYDTTNGDLKVAHCANAFCAPYFRRR